MAPASSPIGCCCLVVPFYEGYVYASKYYKVYAQSFSSGVYSRQASPYPRYTTDKMLLLGLVLVRYEEIALVAECLLRASLAISLASINDTVSSMVLLSSPGHPSTSRFTSSSANPDINTSLAIMSVKSTDWLHSPLGQFTV